MSRARPARRRPRVLAIASGGGHWIQLLRLRPAFADADVVWASVNPRAADEVPGEPYRVVPDATRWNPLRLAVCAVRVALLVARERPDVVVTTGAAPGLLALVAARLLGRRTAWIDSVANVERLSGSGARAGRHADLWLTQWPALARREGPHYEGAVL